MESFATPYPMLFNDGDRELDKGVIGVHSCMTFKRFQSMVGQKTGLPAAQLSTVFVCKRTSGSLEKKQKIPINENTNFGIIISQHNSSKERDCFFLVSLKRSKKERKVSKKRVDADAAEEETGSRKDDGSAKDGVIETTLGPRDQEEKEDGTEAARNATSGGSDTSGGSATSDVSEEVLDVPKAFPGEGTKSQHDCQARAVHLEQPVNASPPQPSAWKSGSILQRLSSASEKLAKVDSACPDVSGSPPLPAVLRNLSGPECPVVKPDKSGMISPTSVLDAGQPCYTDQVIAPPVFAHGAAFSCGSFDQGSFSLFGQDVGGMDLQLLIHDAVMANMQLKRPRWCKFCAFCREKNMASTPFHWCVDDQVVPGFKGPNPAGPIGTRTMKQRVAV